MPYPFPNWGHITLPIHIEESLATISKINGWSAKNTWDGRGLSRVIGPEQAKSFKNVLYNMLGLQTNLIVIQLLAVNLGFFPFSFVTKSNLRMRTTWKADYDFIKMGT